MMRMWVNHQRREERAASSKTTVGSNASHEGPSQGPGGGKKTKHDSESQQVIEELKQSLVENFKSIKLLEKELVDRDATIRSYESGRAVQSRFIDELRQEVESLTNATKEKVDIQPDIGFFAFRHPPRPVGSSLDEPSGQQHLIFEQLPAQKTIDRTESITELIIVPEYRGEPDPVREQETIKFDGPTNDNLHLTGEYKQKIDRQLSTIYELSESLTENLQTIKKLKAEMNEKDERIRQMEESSVNQELTIEELKASSAKLLKEIEQADAERELTKLKDENHEKVLNELNVKLKDEERIVEDLEKGKQEMENMIETLRDNLSEESQRNQVLHHEILLLSMANEKLKAASNEENSSDAQIEAINPEMLAKLEEELEQNMKAVRILEEEKGNSLQLITELKEKLDKTSSVLTEVSTESSEKSACIAELEKMKEKLEKNQEELISTASQRSCEMEELAEKLRLLNATVKELQDKNSEQELELKNLNEKLVLSLKEVERYKGKEHDVNSKLEDVRSVKNEYEEMSVSLRMTINEQTLVLGELRQQLLELQSKHEEEIAEKEDVIQKLSEELDSSLERSVNLQAEAKDNLQVIQELQLEREHQIRINQELKEELTQQASIVQGLQDDLARITEESMTAKPGKFSPQDFQRVMMKINKSDSDDVIYSLDDIERDFTIKDETIRKLNEERNVSLSRIQELEDELCNQENTSAVQKLNSELEARKVMISEQENKLRDSDQMIEELMREVSALQHLQDTLAAKDETIEKLEAMLHLHQDKLKIEERKVKEFEKDMLAQNFVTKEVNAEKAKLAKALDELQKAVHVAEENVARLTEQVEQVTWENEKLRASSGNPLASQEEAEKNLKAQSARVEELVRECDTKADAIARLERQFAALEDQLRDAESARNTVQLLEDQVARRGEKIQQLQKIEDMRVKTIASLESENNLLSEKISDLQKELAELERRSSPVFAEEPLQGRVAGDNGFNVSVAEEKVLDDHERAEGVVTEMNHVLNSLVYTVHVDPNLDDTEQATTHVGSPELTNGVQTKSLEGSAVPEVTPSMKLPATDEALLDQEFDNYSKYPIASLKKRSELLPADVNILRKEVHLSREQFVETFGIEWEEFAKLPAWKQQNLKKKVGLF